MDPSLAISTAVTEAGHTGPGEPSGNSAQSRTVRYGLGRVSEGLLLLEIRGWAAAGYGRAARSKPNNQVRIFITRHSAPGEAGNDATSDARCRRDLKFPEELSAGQVDVLRGVLRELQESQVQQVLDELAGRMKIVRITNPIRYCAALVERIKRGQFTPELGIRIAERRAAERQYSEQRNARSNVDRATLEAMMHRLPDDLRASLERMRKRDQNELSTTPCRDHKNDPES